MTIASKVMVSTALVAGLAACSPGRDSGEFAERNAAPGLAQTPWEQPVPKAECGPDDAPETALQGQVPLSDRVSGRSQQAYSCNLEKVGQFTGEGASWQHAWHEDCAYYDTARLPNPDMPPKPGQMQPGTFVIDASDSANPVMTDLLQTPAMLDPWESLKVDAEREILVGLEESGPGFDTYSLAGDCTQPELLASIDVRDDLEGHTGNLTPDGRTFYFGDRASNFYCPLDIDDPSDPRLLTCWPNPGTTHDVSTSPDGNTGYFTRASTDAANPNGLVVVDTSEVQQRLEDPFISIIGELYWEDGDQAQETDPVTIAGKPYVVFTDELGSDRACTMGLPHSSFARIIDVSDPTAPTVVSKLMLEVHDPANCSSVAPDADGVFVYDAHYCTVDDPDDAQLLACSYFESGIRVFDIRDPYRPREIAYYIPPANPGYLPGSNYNLAGVCPFADWASANPRFKLDRDEIWFTSQCNGFQIVRFTRPLSELMGPAP